MEKHDEHSAMDTLQASLGEINAIHSDMKTELNNFQDTFFRNMKDELANFRKTITRSYLNCNRSESYIEQTERGGTTSDGHGRMEC